MEQNNEIFRRIQSIDAQWAEDIRRDTKQTNLVQELENRRRLNIMMATMVQELPWLAIERSLS